MKRLLIFSISAFFIIAGVSEICFGITAAELKEMIDHHEEITIIDVRGNSAYEEAHIPGAINIPAHLCPVKRLPPLGKVIVYGEGINMDSTLEAIDSLNKKPGIHAQMLEGGIEGWEAFNNPTTRESGMVEEKLAYISYQQMQTALKNQDAVIVDLRRAKKETASKGRSRKGLPEGIDQDTLTDLSAEFPEARVIYSPFEEGTGEKVKDFSDDTPTAPRLKRQQSSGSGFYILIDNGDGAAEDMARRMKASGIRSFAILAGGEEILKRKGNPGLERR